MHYNKCIHLNISFWALWPAVIFNRLSRVFFIGEYMQEKYRKVYESLGAKDKKAFREALAADDLITITAYTRAAGVRPDLLEADSSKKREKGRPALVPEQTSKQQTEQFYKQLRNTKNTTSPEAGSDLDINGFSELYNDIINSVAEQFFSEHPDIIKRPAFMWVNSLLLECKKNLPVIDIYDAGRVAAAWEAYKALMYKVGLFPMMEAFTNLTGIYKETLSHILTPEHEAVRQKIFSDCRDNMISQVGYNPMTQVNKLFLLKAVYGYSENSGGVQQITEKKTKKIDDIPIFGIEEKTEND